MALRTTTSVSSYRRYVNTAIITALRSVFDANYPGEPQLRNLKITRSYPLTKVEYPAVVVNFQAGQVFNAGVGHEEWFKDAQGQLRKWHHSRFEGELSFNCVALSPLDLDIMADALLEVFRFGRLNPELSSFFETLYGSPEAPVDFVLEQIMLDIDTVSFGADAATIAPWEPEDVLVFSTQAGLRVHGSFYNARPQVSYNWIRGVRAESYPQGEIDVVLPFNDHLDNGWSTPFVFTDASKVVAKFMLSGAEGIDGGTPSTTNFVNDFDGGTPSTPNPNYIEQLDGGGYVL